MSRRIGDRGATPLVAGVDWRSEGRWDERPAALWLGGERVEVEVEERWVEGPAAAGGELVRCFVVVDGTGQAYRLRVWSAERTTVERVARAARGPSGGSTPL